MSQRTLAAVVAAPLTLALLALAALLPLPYATYAPGLTVDVLGEEDGEEIIQVRGHKAYRDEGQLRMTTVFVSSPGVRKGLLELMAVWLDDDQAVYPYDVVHREGETVEQNRREGAVDMVTSQDRAVAIALEELGHDVLPAIGVAFVEEDAPAEGVLKVRDLFRRVGGKPVTSPEQVAAAVRATPPGQTVEFEVLRGGEPTTLEVEPAVRDGVPRVGVEIGTFFRFPFEVSVNIDPEIGGPSAGLMFSLGIYDTLTPGSLSGGGTVAGTGTIDSEGAVGPIGGIQQKISGARDAGAELFLVPPDNCAEALGADPAAMRLVRAATVHDARVAIERWAADPDAPLPACEEDE